MGKILITNATVITMNDAQEVLDNASIAIEDSRIVAVGGAKDFRADETIDGTDMVALPGFVNAHTHCAMTLMRGFADDMRLMPWLQTKIWPFEAHLTEEDVYWGTMLGIVEMIKGGTTCFNDMYHHFRGATRAMVEGGIRACPSGVLLGILPEPEARLERSIEFCREWHNAADGRIKVMLAPHALYTVASHLWRRVREAALEMGICVHTHLQETQDELRQIAGQYEDKSPMEVLNDLGVFDAPTLAAHCVYVSERDIEIMKEKGVRVAHNPTSNLKLASGIAPIPRYLSEGITVGIATDGTASNNNLDMLEEMRLTALLHKVTTLDPTTMDAATTLRIATRGGAEALNLGDEVGQIAVGYKADIALFNFDKPHLTPRHNVVSHLVYAAEAADVDTVIIDGKVVLRHREFTTLDEERIKAEASQCARRLVEKVGR